MTYGPTIIANWLGDQSQVSKFDNIHENSHNLTILIFFIIIQKVPTQLVGNRVANIPIEYNINPKILRIIICLTY
jgi:hypothetical protein